MTSVGCWYLQAHSTAGVAARSTWHLLPLWSVGVDASHDLGALLTNPLQHYITIPLQECAASALYRAVCALPQLHVRCGCQQWYKQIVWSK